MRNNRKTLKIRKVWQTHLFKTGNANSFICAALYRQQQSEIDRKIFGAPVKFTEEPCSVCCGAKMANTDGKENRRCAHCKNERGTATGLEPEQGEKFNKTIHTANHIGRNEARDCSAEISLTALG